jgi:hypothetical protein
MRLKGQVIKRARLRNGDMVEVSGLRLTFMAGDS